MMLMRDKIRMGWTVGLALSDGVRRAGVDAVGRLCSLDTTFPLFRLWRLRCGDAGLE
jgi:hypothetical protein